MAARGSGIGRWFVVIVLVAAVGVGFYTYRRQDASNRIKAEMLQIVNEMAIPSASREDVRLLVESYHREAFDKAMDLTKKIGRKFDTQAYYEEILDLVIARIREEGDVDLADNIDRERAHFALRVSEH